MRVSSLHNTRELSRPSLLLASSPVCLFLAQWRPFGESNPAGGRGSWAQGPAEGQACALRRLPFSGFRLPRLLLPLLCRVLSVLCSKREVRSCDGIVAKFMISSFQLSVSVSFCSQNHTPVSSASERGSRASFGVETKFPATPVTAPELVLDFGMKISPLAALRGAHSPSRMAVMP